MPLENCENFETWGYQRILDLLRGGLQERLCSGFYGGFFPRKTTVGESVDTCKMIVIMAVHEYINRIRLKWLPLDLGRFKNLQN